MMLPMRKGSGASRLRPGRGEPEEWLLRPDAKFPATDSESSKSHQASCTTRSAELVRENDFLVELGARKGGASRQSEIDRHHKMR